MPSSHAAFAAYTSLPMRPLLAVFLFLASSPVLIAATIVVDVRDRRGAAVADAVVSAVPVGAEAPFVRKTAVMDQKNRMFIPHVLAIQTGTAVRFPNSDDIRHQVYSFSPAKTFQLPLYEGTPASPIVFDKAGVATLGCNIHDRMSAYIVVVDTPWFATTTGKERITMTDLPAGRYRVHLWWPEMRNEVAPVEVTLTASDRTELTLTTR